MRMDTQHKYNSHVYGTTVRSHVKLDITRTIFNSNQFYTIVFLFETLHVLHVKYITHVTIIIKVRTTPDIDN